MFSLLVGLHSGVIPHGRLLEHTDSELAARLELDPSSLSTMPALSMPELKQAQHRQVATFGTISWLRPHPKGHQFHFSPNRSLTPIASSIVEGLASELQVDARRWELHRTHLAVKNVDLFEVLYTLMTRADREADGPSSAGAVSFPTCSAREPDLVAVMMPFDSAFDVVYETIEAAVADAGLRCARVDDLWEQDHIMDDVTSLLWRSQVVIADLSGRNSNVFYETGLAHALPRRTVLLTQDANDIPFDLKAIRHLRYGIGTTERAALRAQLSDRLTTLIANDVR